MKKDCIRVLNPWIGMLMICASLCKAGAADAYFSPDGKTVTLAFSQVFIISDKGTNLERPASLAKVDVETGVLTPIPLPKSFENAEIDSIAAGAEGEILFLAKDSVWVIKGNEPPREVCKTAGLVKPTDLIVVTDQKSPLKDWLLVSATEKAKEQKGQRWGPTLYARKPGGNEFQAIFCRRTPNVNSGAFTSDGRFIFVCESDVWAGEIVGNDDPTYWMGVLNGARVAPLSTLSTNEANAGAMWVRELVTAGSWIYAYQHGHHMGAIVRTPLPGALGDEPSIADQYRTMAECLTKTEVIDDSGEFTDHLCAWERNGKTRLFYSNRHNFLLWNGHGKSKVIGKMPER